MLSLNKSLNLLGLTLCLTFLAGCQGDSALSSEGTSVAVSQYQPLIEDLASEDSEARVESSEGISRFDLDGDGLLSDEERAAARETMKAEFLAKYDSDGNGEISEEEHQAAHEAMHQAFLEKYDLDGDGRLSEEERAAVDSHHPGWGPHHGPRHRNPEERQARFLEEFDSDGDGVLSETERDAIRERFPRPPRPHRGFWT